MHEIAFQRINVIPTGQMKQAVDEVKGDFSFVGVGVFKSLACCGIQTDEDFAVVKRDDVCGGGVIEKLGVNVGNGGIADEADFDLLKGCQRSFGKFQLGQAEGQGRGGSFAPEGEMQRLTAMMGVELKLGQGLL